MNFGEDTNVQSPAMLKDFSIRGSTARETNNKNDLDVMQKNLKKEQI